MTDVNYTFGDRFDETIRRLNALYEPVLAREDEEYHSDLNLLSVVIGTLFGMLGSYTVNNLPTFKDFSAGFTRRQLQQLEDLLRKNSYRFDYSAVRTTMIGHVAEMLPPSTTRRQLAAEAVDIVFSQMTSDESK